MAGGSAITARVQAVKVSKLCIVGFGHNYEHNVHTTRHRCCTTASRTNQHQSSCQHLQMRPRTGVRNLQTHNRLLASVRFVTSKVRTAFSATQERNFIGNRGHHTKVALSLLHAFRQYRREQEKSSTPKNRAAKQWTHPCVSRRTNHYRCFVSGENIWQYRVFVLQMH